MAHVLIAFSSCLVHRHTNHHLVFVSIKSRIQLWFARIPLFKDSTRDTVNTVLKFASPSSHPIFKKHFKKKERYNIITMGSDYTHTAYWNTFVGVKHIELNHILYCSNQIAAFTVKN